MEGIVLGLQRSGTNYLESLLRMNFKNLSVVPGSTKYCWKHGLPHEKYRYDKASNKTHIENLINNKPIVVIVRKKYELWLESLNKYSADFIYHRKGLLENPDKTELKQFHEEFHIEWEKELIANDIKFIVIEYIDLVKDYKKVLETIANEFGVIPKGEYADISKVYQSQPVDQAKKDLYIKKYNNLK
jgi:hypothetical protein